MNDFEDILDSYLNFSNGGVDGGNSQANRQEIRVLTQPSTAYQNQLYNSRIQGTINKIADKATQIASAPYNVTNTILNSKMVKHMNGIPTSGAATGLDALKGAVTNNPGQSWANAINNRKLVATDSYQANNLASKFTDEINGSVTGRNTLNKVIAKRANALGRPQDTGMLEGIVNANGKLDPKQVAYMKNDGPFINAEGKAETRWNSKDALTDQNGIVRQTKSNYLRGGIGAATVGGLVSGGLTLAQTGDISEAANATKNGALIGAGAYAGNKLIEKGATKLLENGMASGSKAANTVSKVLLGNKGIAEASKLAEKDLAEAFTKIGAKTTRDKVTKIASEKGAKEAAEWLAKKSTAKGAKEAAEIVAAKGSAKVASNAGSKVVPFVGGALTVGMAAKDIYKDMQRSDQYWKSKKTGKASKWIRTALNGISAAGGVISCIPIAGQAVGMVVGLAADGGNMLGQAFNLWSTENEEVKTANLHTQI